MTGFEYKVVPAPKRGLKGKGIKGTEARFANALQKVMNELGAEGWEYQRTDTLPVEERQGLTGKSTSFQNMLVFRRTLVADLAEVAPVAALIEDQSDSMQPAQDEVVEAVDDAEAYDPVEDDVETDDVEMDSVRIIPAPQDASTEDAPQATEAAAAETAQERVDETLKSSFSFPWSGKRAKQSDEAKDKGDSDDPHVAAE